MFVVSRFMKTSLIALCVLLFGSAMVASSAAGRAATLVIDHSISDEPLLGGTVVFNIDISNSGATPVTDKGYNLTIEDTLPVGLDYVSSEPAATFAEANADGTTTLYWDNIADLEVNEELNISITASVASNLSTSSSFLNSVTAKVNTAPDNSGSWVEVTDDLSGSPQAIDIEVEANQSTADEQATGAGEFDGSARWPYSYTVTVRNNNVADSEDVVAKVMLPSGIAYMGNPVISPNPNGSAAAPTLDLQADGSLELTWSLGTLTTAEYAAPVEITFDTAIPYAHRTSADTSAEAGAFAGPMSGVVIAEDTVLPVAYEATAEYSNLATSDGTDSTPGDDKPEKVVAEYLALSKSASPRAVGVGDTVTFTLNWYVSEYYTTSNVVIVDVLPDGMTYVPDSASIAPVSVQNDTPGAGQTTITWNIASADTEAGDTGTLTLQATVDNEWEAAPYTNEPLVSGDGLVNVANSNGEWVDTQSARSGTLIEDVSRAAMSTRMPTFTKEVWNPIAGEWSNTMDAYVGDTARFRLSFNAAADINASDIVIRDFLPRGMTWNNTADHTISAAGDFTSDSDCTSTPTTPTSGMLSGLQYIEWSLCDVNMGGTWEVIIEAQIGDESVVQPGWIVANFGKLSGQNTFGDAYSMRALANVVYSAPELEVVKSSSPWKNLDGGDTIEYSIAVTNVGEATAYNIVLTDILPADLVFANSGGTSTPAGSTYTTISGDPSAATGGTVEWSTVASLAEGDSITFKYSATVPTGLFAGQSMTNLASVSYNSRSDNNGHQTDSTNSVDDINTDDHTVFVRGVTIDKTPSVDFATIGDNVQWTLTVTVPAGVVAHWPIVEENNLPDGFDYVDGSTVITGATLDTTNHAANPADSGWKDLRWFVETIDNSSAATPYVFTIVFDSLITGVKGTDTSETYYDINCCHANADNDAFVGWYDDASGYNGTGFAYTGFGGKNHVDKRSPQADADVTIRQPYLVFDKAADRAEAGASDMVIFTLQTTNLGNDIAWETLIEDALPTGMTFVETVSSDITPPDGVTLPPSTLTDNNVVGATNLQFELDRIYVGSVWTLKFKAQMDANIAASLTLTNTAQIAQYTSKEGVVGDTNGDSLADERIYPGPSDDAVVTTPHGTIRKEMTVLGEFTVGATVIYTVTVPGQPVNAALPNAFVADVVDDALEVQSVSAGAFASGNAVFQNFGTIAPMDQKQIIITAVVPDDTDAVSGNVVTNLATLNYDGHDQISSNIVQDTFVAPALVVDKLVDKPFIVENDALKYTIVVHNVGDSSATNFTLTDTPPANITLRNGTSMLNGAPVSDPVGGVWTFPTHVLQAGESFILTVEADVTGTVADNTPYVNSVAVTAEDSKGRAIPVDNSAMVSADTDPTDTGEVAVYGNLEWVLQDDTFVAYEDLRNINYVDWDYNDFIVNIDAEYAILPHGDLAAIRLDYESIARGAFLNHEFIHQIPIYGGGQAYLTVYDANGAVVSNQNIALGDDPEITVFENTNEALPVATGVNFTNTEREQTFVVDGYTAKITITLVDPTQNYSLLLPRLPWDPYIYVYDTDQEVHLPIPGHSDNMQTVNGLFDPNNPLIGYSLPLARVLDADWDWPIEAVGMWRSHPMYDDHISTGETRHTEWYQPANAAEEWTWAFYSGGRVAEWNREPYRSGPDSRYYASPVSVDFGGDGQMEIIMANLLANRVELFNATGQPLWDSSKGMTDGNIKATPALADIAGDATPEIIVGDSTGKIYAFDANGDRVAGWPVQLAGFRVLATPAVGDIDGSGLSILVPLANGRLYALDINGNLKWQAGIGDVVDKFDSQLINSSPVIADLQGDGSVEIIVGAFDGKVYILDNVGQVVASYQTDDIIYSTPAVAEIDGDTASKEIVIGSGDSNVYVLNDDATLVQKMRTGWIIKSSPVIADIDGDNEVEIVIGSDDKAVWAWETDGTRVAGWPKVVDSAIEGKPAVGDIDGDGDMEVVVATSGAQVHAWHGESGNVVGGWPQSTTVSVFATPMLTNLDADGALEVVVGDFDGNLYIWGGVYQLYLPMLSAGN